MTVPRSNTTNILINANPNNKGVQVKFSRVYAYNGRNGNRKCIVSQKWKISYYI